jgi:hypothetical protein
MRSEPPPCDTLVVDRTFEILDVDAHLALPA